MTAILAIVLSLLALQQAPVRDGAPAAPRPTGTAAIAGVVVTEDASPRPVRRAMVMLTSGLALPQSTVTDDEGRFLFPNLAAGTYTIVVTKAGFIAAYYKSPRPGRAPGMPIAVADGQRVSDITMRLLHGSAISGTVRRVAGQSAVGLTVTATPVETINGERRSRLQGTGAAQTDDRGTYRIFGLAPGDYVIATTPVDFTALGPAGAGLRQITPEELRWAERSAMSTVPGATSTPAPPPGRPATYSTVFYPGTPDASAASVVTVGANEDRGGLDFFTPLVPTAKITGIVVDAEGKPVRGARVQVQGKASAGDMGEMMMAMVGLSGSTTNAEGEFTLNGITPGTVTISTRATPRGADDAPPAQDRGGLNSAGAIGALSGLLGGGLTGATQWANQEVSVRGDDISGITLRLQPGMTVSGKIVYQGTSATPPDPTRSRVSLSTMPTGTSQTDMVMSLMGSTLGVASADGTFTMKGVMPGRYRITIFAPGMLFNQQIPGAGDGWSLKSAMLNGRDVSDAAFDVRPGEDVSGIVVTFTDRPSELSGHVLDAAGRPVGNFPIVVFSTDRTNWTLASRRVQLLRPSTDGKYTANGLPPGEYYICAVTEADENTLYDPSFLEILVPGAFKLTLGDGEKKVQDLRIGG